MQNYNYHFLLIMEIISNLKLNAFGLEWTSDICPHHTYTFQSEARGREVRMTQFFTLILGMDDKRSKQIRGELTKPFRNGTTHESLLYWAGTREPQRFNLIQRLEDVEEVFEFLWLLENVHRCERSIPIPFSGDNALEFSWNMYQDEKTFLEQTMNEIPRKAMMRVYLMKKWFTFRKLGKHLIEKGHSIKDVMNAFEVRKNCYLLPYNIGQLVKLIK